MALVRCAVGRGVAAIRHKSGSRSYTYYAVQTLREEFSRFEGEGTVFGAIVGALIIQSLSNGLQMMNVSSNVQYLIKGLVLILAVLADISMKKKRA